MLLFATLLSTNFGCAALFDAELKGKELPKDENGNIDYEKLGEQMAEEYIQQNFTRWYPKDFLEVSAGFGLNSTEGDSETSLCFGAGYNYRISEDNYNGASFLNASAIYHTQSADDRKLNTTNLSLGYTYFDRINKTAELDLTYGIKASYEIGSLENFGVKEDITGYGVSALIGANYNVNENFSIGITVPFLTWSQRTFEFEGNEFEQENTWLGINKDNLVMAYGRINLD